jgi:toxin ParE1/3/4
MAESRRPLAWSPEALSDLSEIWDYYVKIAGRHTADGIVRRVGEVCALLEDHPFAGRARNEVRPGLRSIAASPHIVFYRVNEGSAEVIRILDGRRDVDEIFAHDP